MWVFLMTTLSTTNAAAESFAFENPLVPQRADPWVHRTEAGRYYFVATAPEFDRIELRAADSIGAIRDARATVVWRKRESGPMGAHIWAPELHRIEGRWYIYFAAGDADDIWRIRMYVLSNDSEDPTQGRWTEEGTIATAWDSFSLDATTFEHRGKRYLIWAQAPFDRDENSALYLAEMASPTAIKLATTIEISRPEFDWERVGHKVNEGPAVLIRNGKVFVSYSASATDHNYAMGLLWADEDADLLDAASWQKSAEPVMTSGNGQFGPGHNCFTLAEDGETVVLIYHARPYRKLQCWALSDPNRHARAQVLKWDADGMPVFGKPVADRSLGVVVVPEATRRPSKIRH